MTATNSATQSGGTGTSTTTVSQEFVTTGTATQTATASSIGSQWNASSGTQTVTGTQTLTGTITTTSVLLPVPDPNVCTASSCGGTSGYCYLNSTVPCSSDSTCTSLTQGDFCRYLNLNDGTNRFKNDFCVPNPNPGGKTTCRYQQALSCTVNSTCDSGVGDYCVNGTPAQMCQKTGLWCADDSTGCDASSGDICVPATSRLMMVKNAVKRVVLEHAYDDSAVVKMGHMHTYQAGNGSTDNLFPYVKLDTTSVGTAFRTSTRTDTKFLPRSELLKGHDSTGTQPCFSESTGPSGYCTIDYSGGGALTSTPAVTYTLQTGNNSRFAVPTGDGKTYTRQYADWTNPTGSGCGVLCPFPSVGNGVYEGSYYTFNYTWGVPVVGSPSDAPGTGSVYAPKYSSTYLGKSYGLPGNYWYLMDAERSEYVNENKYGAREFTGITSAGAGLPWSQGWVPTGDEYPLPLVGVDGDPLSTAATCGASNGAQWDHNVVPMVNSTSLGGNSSLKPTQKALLNAARLDKASYGGFYATGHIEPVACALQNDGANDSQHSVAGYMTVVKSNDGSACWKDHVLLVVDGLPRGPGDVAVGGVDCGAQACTYQPDSLKANYNPNLNGCVCPAVTKARALAASGVNVHVIAATTDLTSRNWYAAATLNNIARAGSTSTSFINIPRYAASEDELYYWLNYEMKDALRVTVATTPASAASGSQTMQGVTVGNMLFQTTVELPEWRGNLVAFSIGTATTTTTGTATATTYTTQLAWDAATVNTFTVRPGFPPSQAQQQTWKQRNVFFSDASGNVQQIHVDSTGTIRSDTIQALYALKMGGNTAETALIVQWMLGMIDPSDTIDYKPLNPAVMGSVLNSMPIDVGPPGPSGMPGGNHFWNVYAHRPELVYLGADDGMLHAFYAASGQEAFAFIPADMVPVIAKLYAQGGQRYSPNDHVYGLAGSPKVKNVCVANCAVTTCSDDANASYPDTCPQWKTILVMGVGLGGNRPFALDITDPVESDIAQLDSNSLLWHAGYKPTSGGISGSAFGETLSVPAFAYNRTAGENDVLVASGYAASASSTTLIDATALSGAAAGPGVTTISGSGGCTQAFEVAADVATARDNHGTTPDQNLLATYVADTWGTLHQYYSSALTTAGTQTPLSLGCTQPLHFSPAVVQLNRNIPNSNDNSVFLAQVTNSVLDPNTVGSSAPSELVVAKLSSIGNTPPPPTLDTTFGSNGLITLSAGTGGQLCGVTTGSTGSGCGTGGTVLPATARPTGTPVAVLRSDGTGFQLYTTWYTPPAANWDNCSGSSTNGNSYITVHQFLSAGSGSWKQLYGIQIPHQYVTGVQFAGTTLFITYGDGTPPGTPTGLGNFNQAFISASQSMARLSGDRFVRTAWTERLDAE